MKRVGSIFAAAVMWLALSGAAAAQTSCVTVTNYVTVIITNIVTVTNVVRALPVVAAPVVTAPIVTPVAPAPVKTNQWNNAVSVGVTLARGNTDITLVSGEFQSAKKTPKDEYSATLGAAFGEQAAKQTVDNYKGSFQWNHFLTKHTYDYLRGDGLRDYIADVDYRITVGPGLGYYLLKTTNTLLSVESGANFERQSLGGLEDTFATFRLGNKFEHKVNNHARFWESFEVVPQADQFANYVVNFEIGLETTFARSLSLKTCLDDNYDNRPAAQHLKNDLKLVAGVAYKF